MDPGTVCAIRSERGAYCRKAVLSTQKSAEAIGVGKNAKGQINKSLQYDGDNLVIDSHNNFIACHQSI